jgi:hypothetical protein
MKKQSNSIRFIYFGAIVALAIVFGIFVLEKAQVTNFYSKPVVASEVATVRPVNSVEYTPADPTDNDEINQKKADGTLGASNSTPAGAPINVVLTAAGQDSAGGPVVVKVLLTDVTSGTCDMTLTQNEVTKSYSASVINAGNYYTCDGFEIPFEDLTVGTWNLTVTVTSTERTGSATQIVEVKQ